MLLAVIGFIAGIYSTARLVVKNEPLKSQLDLIFNNANQSLSLFKDNRPSSVLEGLLRFSTKALTYIMLISMIILFFPKRIEELIFYLITPIFIFLGLLTFSISWIQQHSKNFKKLFLDPVILTLLFAPLIFYHIDLYMAPEKGISRVFDFLKIVFGDLNIFYLQLIWILLIIVFVYFGSLILAFPIYITLYTIIMFAIYFIKIVEKYIDKHILDAIAGLITLSVLFFKIFV